jgi:hypothetical protein
MFSKGVLTILEAFILKFAILPVPRSKLSVDIQEQKKKLPF